MRRLAREMREGVLSFDAPLGEPPIDVDGEDGARASRLVYVAPEEGVRHTTAPVIPGERVSVAPDALPDVPAGGGAHFDSAVTAPLPSAARSQASPAAAHRTTTAPVPPMMMATTPMRRAPPSRRWIAGLALALAVPAAAGLGLRTWTPLAPSHVAAPPATAAAAAPSAAPSAAVPSPAEHDEGAAPSGSPSSPPERPAATVVAAAPRGSTGAARALSQPRRREGTSDPIRGEARAVAPVLTTPTAAPAAPPPTPAPSASHRVFGTDD